MSNDSKLRTAMNAILAVSARRLHALTEMAKNLAGPDGEEWHRTLKAQLKAGVSGAAMQPAPTHKEDLTRFFFEVFGLEVDLDDANLDASDGEIAMFNPNILTASELVKQGCKHFKLSDPYFYKSLDEVRDTSVRPNGEYVFVYKDSPARDLPGVSYNQAKKQNLCILNLVEYILATFFSKWKTGKFLDISGWTRLDALWFDDGVVGADWLGGRLYFGWRDRGRSNTNGGPRSVVIRPLGS
ncbi:MAG: hypothetical protein RI996_310 [Candidatus Parcubacteria bacterium]|jgi:hypothetical protein